MPKHEAKEQVFLKCEADGMLLPQKEINLGRINTVLAIADEDLKTIEELKDKNDRANTVYKLAYDVIHSLAEALLLFDKIKSMNHKCLFAYLCVKYEDLELDFNFFEKIRTKRNGIHYYGSFTSINEWRSIELQVMLYIKTLQKEILKKIELSYR
ncbi:MAG: hypothetical protein ACMXYG_02775 [Candidatus Woesearchaeota archaeon]